MCQYCGETFQNPKTREIYIGHYPLLENIPIKLLYLVVEINSKINESKKLNFLRHLEDIIEEFKIAPDIKLSFSMKEKLKLKLENLVFSIYSDNMCAWESIITEYFYLGRFKLLDSKNTI